ncbi:MAG: TrkA family potassium uptake protein [Ardenticatenaceae bacterium]|nr:TrkA family potassium uptake protein [Ardenticatenaceae bacterium]
MGKKEFAVIGLGRFGSNVALTLEKNGHAVLGIDENPEVIQQMAPLITQAVGLDATNENALRSVDIGSFHTVVIAIGSDFENNLMTTVTCKNLSVPNIICKALTIRQEEILLRIGADRVIRPEHEAGVRLAESLLAPSMLEYFSLGPDTDYRLAEFEVPSCIACQSLAQSDIRNRYGISVLVIKRGRDVVMNPPPEAILQPNDILVVLGHDKEIESFAQLN